MPEWKPFDEQERLTVVRDIAQRHPGLDLERSLAGALLGPASPDRPDAPVWRHLDVVAADPSVSLRQLAAVRFPVLLFGGESSVTSVDEELQPLPAHLKDPPRARVVVDARDVIRRYGMEHDAGLVEWDPRSGGIRHLAPPEARRAVARQWSASLRTADD